MSEYLHLGLPLHLDLGPNPSSCHTPIEMRIARRANERPVGQQPIPTSPICPDRRSRARNDGMRQNKKKHGPSFPASTVPHSTARKKKTRLNSKMGHTVYARLHQTRWAGGRTRGANLPRWGVPYRKNTNARVNESPAAPIGRAPRTHPPRGNDRQAKPGQVLPRVEVSPRRKTNPHPVPRPGCGVRLCTCVGMLK